ncbi:hypothetical protein ANN_26716 [Periplaneta americana]|uniref:Uncharacterized protein n=1 Tax=Periplaneta americana TaxID=6978 RepID=A0ABQ8RZ43_PERAM|nr:hypothetical protein ANN_26716 [Periplaneta americana]
MPCPSQTSGFNVPNYVRKNISSNISAVRAISGRTLSTIHCRHPDCSELETLGHVLGQGPKGELLINARHHRVRHTLATSPQSVEVAVSVDVHGIWTCNTYSCRMCGYSASALAFHEDGPGSVCVECMMHFTSPSFHLSEQLDKADRTAAPTMLATSDLAVPK